MVVRCSCRQASCPSSPASRGACLLLRSSFTELAQLVCLFCYLLIFAEYLFHSNICYFRFPYKDNGRQSVIVWLSAVYSSCPEFSSLITLGNSPLVSYEQLQTNNLPLSSLPELDPPAVLAWPPPFHRPQYNVCDSLLQLSPENRPPYMWPTIPSRS